MTAHIEVCELVKDYHGVRAVNGVSFSIPKGRCFGLLGPNGAGKTTTIEIMEGITSPSSGQILYKQKPIGKRFQTEAGIQFQSTQLQDFLTVGEILDLFKSLYKNSADIDMLVERCALGEFIDRDNRKLSGGQRQRMLLAIALINNPEIIFLDEPTTGLDPQARRNFWELIESIKAEGRTIVLTTHYMEEAYTLCDEIAIMDHGKIIAQGTPKSLLKEHFNDIILSLPNDDLDSKVTFNQDSKLRIISRNEHVDIHTDDVNQTIALLIEKGIRLDNLRIRERTLEDLFIELTGKQLRA